jgi:hypothetical protein
MRRFSIRTNALLLLVLAAAVLVGATQAFAVDQTPKNGCTSPAVYSGAITSPSFDTGTGPTVSFNGWYEIEAVAPSAFDRPTVEYSLASDPGTFIFAGSPVPSSPETGNPDQGYSNNGLASAPTFASFTIPLPPEAESQTGVQLRIRFDTGDETYQGFRGVGVDDIAINTGVGGSTNPSTEAFESTPVWILDPAGPAGTPFWRVIDNGAGISVTNPLINPDLVTLPDAGAALPTNGAPGTHYAWFGDPATGTFCGPDYANRFVAPPFPPPPPPVPPVPPKTLKDLPPPVLGKEANVEPVSGTVLVGIKGGAAAAGRGVRTSQEGITFVPLQEARQVPVGSFLDTRKGTVALQSSAGSKKKTYLGNFSSGLFQVLQSRKKKSKGLTDLVMKGGKFASCTAKKKGKRASAALSKKALRRLRGKAKGRFRTRGRYSAATVRGTKWTVTDRCDGTLTQVQRGKVAVRDFRRKKTVLVKTGKSYLAKAPR